MYKEQFVTSQENQGEFVVGVALAFLVARLHHPFAVATRDPHGVPAALLVEDAVSFAAHSQLLLHRQLLALNAHRCPHRQIFGPSSGLGEARPPGAGDLESGAVTAMKQK